MTIPMRDLMELAVQQNASDIHLKFNNPPILRVDGVLRRISNCQPLNDEDLRYYLSQIASPIDIAKFEKVFELDLSYYFEKKARFRVNVCKDEAC